MFTGKNKEQFEKWLHEWGMSKENKEKCDSLSDDSEGCGYWGTIAFYFLPKPMQQGVYLEYLDSVSYHIKSWHDWEYDYYAFNIVNLYGETLKWRSGYKSRQEALTEAFKKADELIN